MTSPILRQVFAAVKRALKIYHDAQIVFQFVPEHIIINSLENSASHDRNLELLCHSLYERILLPVDRYMSRRFFEHGERIRNYFQEPAFTLTRPPHNKVKFLRQTPLRSLDVVDRHTLLHVGYQVSLCGKWILAACVDQRGEAHDLGVWHMQGDAVETQIVIQVWEFALKFARRANVEWRIVIAKLGSIGETELDRMFLSSLRALFFG
jgi:mediator of RNA polymerase II transcription subunit 13, fungi type